LSRRSRTPRGGGVRELFRGSVIFSAIDRFTQHIYDALKNGVFGRLFSAYASAADPLSPDVSHAGTSSGFFHSRVVLPLRRFLLRTVENAFTVRLVRRIIDFFLRCRTRVYGTFLLTFGAYALLACVLNALGEGTVSVVSLTVAALMIVSSIPLMLTNTSLSQVLLGSAFALPILELIGIRPQSLRTSGESGRSNIAFIVGMACGLLSFFTPAYLILGAILLIILAYRVLVTPEVGVFLLFVGMPFLPTMALVALVCYTALCCLVKLILGKRRFRMEALDASALTFAFALLCGGLFSFSSASRKPALVFLCFLCAYFLTVILIRTREWLLRCFGGALFSATLVALYGIAQYFILPSSEAGAWLDTSMFEDISGRVVSTLENPNMLAEYLILLFPFAAALLLSRGVPAKKLAALFACGAIGVCIILTWSRGAWLGLLLGALVFLLIWNRRTIYLILAGVASIPFLPLVLPDSIVSRFTSIGNIADTSTSYRLNIWRGAVHMLEDYWSCGIGIGEAAWDTVYPRYSLAAIETAPHAHNLYLQIWVETGVVGILLLIVFLFLLLQCAFTFFGDLSRMKNEVSASALGTGIKDAPVSVSVLEKGPAADRAARQEITALRLEIAAPLCGILATLVQGFTDYTWYNYRVYLMFWLAAGLCAAYVRYGSRELRRILGRTQSLSDSPAETWADIRLRPRSENKKATPRKGSSAHAKV